MGNGISSFIVIITFQILTKIQANMSKTTQTKSQKAPLEGFHPKQHKVTIVMTDGSKIEVLTTKGKEGDVIRLDVDPRNHPAWQEKANNFINSNDERVAKFRKKFEGFDSV